jgi:hypothetical protein
MNERHELSTIGDSEHLDKYKINFLLVKLEMIHEYSNDMHVNIVLNLVIDEC